MSEDEVLLCATAKMKGKEIFASLFYLTLYLSSSISKDVAIQRIE